MKNIKEILKNTDKYIVKAKEEKTKLPKHESLALELGVCRKTLYNLAKKYPKFKDKLEEISLIQLIRLIDDGLYGGRNVNPAIVKLILVSNHNFKSENINNNLTGKVESKFNDRQINKIADRISRRNGRNDNSPSTE
jgi:hypothetical protein